MGQNPNSKQIINKEATNNTTKNELDKPGMCMICMSIFLGQNGDGWNTLQG